MKKRLIVAGTDGRYYYGEKEGDLPPAAAAEIVLTNAWEVLHMDQTFQQGETSGFARRFMFMPVSLCKDPLKKLHVKPAAWFDVDEGEIGDRIDALIEQASASLAQEKEQIEALKKQAQARGSRIIHPGASAANPQTGLAQAINRNIRQGKG